MRSSLPEIVTHNYDPAHSPFRNICSLSELDARAILEEISASGTRHIKPDYIERRLTERWLLTKRPAKMGVPPIQYPTYFFLGDFSDGLDPRPLSIKLSIALFAADTISFTFGDSMTSFAATHSQELRQISPHYGRLFTLHEIREIVSVSGLPHRANGSLHPRFIEMQLWDDRPLQHLGIR